MELRFRVLARMTLALMSIALLVALVDLRSDADEKPATLTGVVTDSMCGAKHMMSGDDAKCVRACLKNGAQYALLVDQKVYQLEGKSKELDELAGKGDGHRYIEYHLPPRGISQAGRCDSTDRQPVVQRCCKSTRNRDH